MSGLKRRIEPKMLVQPILFVALLASANMAQAKCQATRIETDLNGVRLDDGPSSLRTLANPDALPIGASDERSKINDFPELILYNRNKTEQALLTRYPGASAGEFAIIKVQMPRKSLTGLTIKTDHLATERGIRLGVSEKFVTDLLGKCYSRRVLNPGDVMIEYRLDDSAHPFLTRTGMPNYFGRYRFSRGNLIYFELGSDYP